MGVVAHLGPSLRRRSTRAPRPWRRASIALAVSLLVNALALWRVDVGGLRPRPGAAPPREVALSPLSARDWAANRAVTDARGRPVPPAVPRPLPPPPAQQKPPQVPGQVVETAPSKDERAPKDARFAAERNNTVEKETRARVPGTGGTASGPKGPAAPPPSPPAVVAQPQQQRPAPAPGQRSAGGQRAAQERGKLALAPGPRADLPTPSPDTGATRGGARGEEGQPPEPDALRNLNLRPGATVFDRMVSAGGGGGGGGSPDHIEGVEDGDQTFLNTREWKYATYFNRIKQAVAATWDPGRELQARDPSGNVFGYKDRVTVVSVTLDDHGTLTNVLVQKTCGVEFLDRTAVQAFQKAQPFVNPPPGLVDPRGEIKFTFGFYLEFGSPGLRLFRAPSPP